MVNSCSGDGLSPYCYLWGLMSEGPKLCGKRGGEAGLLDFSVYEKDCNTHTHSIKPTHILSVKYLEQVTQE